MVSEVSGFSNIYPCYRKLPSKKKIMNCKEANNYSIVEWLKLEGIVPTRSKIINHWYPSPFRGEKDPSFKVDSARNVWYDFGLGVGGTLVDLVCWLHNVEVPEALEIISGDKKKLTASLFFQKQPAVFRQGLEITNVSNVKRSALIQYLRDRMIDDRSALYYLKEVTYIVGESKYFALGFRNDKGGYELRNKYFKGSSSPKTITTIPGDSRILNVFEGFMDYLSALGHFRLTRPNNTTVVLNSLAHLDLVMDKLNDFDLIHLYLDNDEAGRKAADRIVASHNNVVNYSSKIFPNHKDFNEYILSRYSHVKNIHNP